MVFSFLLFSRELVNRIGSQALKPGYSGDNITGPIINYPNGILITIGRPKSLMLIYRGMYRDLRTAMGEYSGKHKQGICKTLLISGLRTYRLDTICQRRLYQRSMR